MAVGITVKGDIDLEKYFDAKYINIDESTEYTAATQGNRVVIVSNVSGTIDKTSTSGSGNITTTQYTLSTVPGIPAGTYEVRNLLQRLVNMSHTHATAKGTSYSNCNCNCDCDCNCDLDCSGDCNCFCDCRD